MSILPYYQSVRDIRYGQDAGFDAWLLHLMTENNIEYSIAPQKNASPEQIRFMVALEPDTVFLPCSDWMFHQLATPELSEVLMREYLSKWRIIVDLVISIAPDKYTRQKVLNLCRHRFRLYIASSILIPSRLLKQMTTIVLALCGMDDPYRSRKQALNRRAKAVIDGPECEKLINMCPDKLLACKRMDTLRHEIDVMELWRWMRLSTLPDMWGNGDENIPLDSIMDMAVETGKPDRSLQTALEKNTGRKGIILFLPNKSGGIMFDLMIVKGLIRLGHRVIMAFKEGFYYQAPTLWDVESDPVMAEGFKNAYFFHDDKATKNELLRVVGEHPFVVISDGTRERLNLYRTSVTFARAWKESDLIMAKGERNYYRLIQTTHKLTRDVLCFYRDEFGQFHTHFKPKADWIVKFSENDLTAKAEEIIHGMRQAAMNGKTVMFYSGVIGSIPGQTQQAIEVINTYINHLRSRLDRAWIINPGEHFVEGMDADDLMYMWEKVQRSGLINVWRFQTFEDIERSFELMGRKVPPVWAGKDATYSTGCTKEMHIALDMQRTHPELQIIGPSPEKFFRRREYGVGKFCDAGIDVC